MPKQKTHKGMSKRVIVKKGKQTKYFTRKTTQDHFNAADTGKTSRSKRGKKRLDKSNKKLVQSTLKTKY